MLGSRQKHCLGCLCLQLLLQSEQPLLGLLPGLELAVGSVAAIEPTGLLGQLLQPVLQEVEAVLLHLEYLEWQDCLLLLLLLLPA